jgi:hypothetical protein
MRRLDRIYMFTYSTFARWPLNIGLTVACSSILTFVMFTNTDTVHYEILLAHILKYKVNVKKKMIICYTIVFVYIDIKPRL